MEKKEPKKLSTYRLPVEVREMLKMMAKQDKRSESQMLEILIEKECERKGITISKEAAKKELPKDEKR